MTLRRSFLDLRVGRNYRDYLLGVAVTAAAVIALVGIGLLAVLAGRLLFLR